jgi:hypothetical protein
MTTSWALATQGRLAEAVRVHTVGTALAALALGASVTLLAVAARGRWITRRINDSAVAAIALAGVGVVLLEWLVRLAQG